MLSLKMAKKLETYSWSAIMRVNVSVALEFLYFAGRIT
jgi:hypothetical protein